MPLPPLRGRDGGWCPDSQSTTTIYPSWRALADRHNGQFARTGS